MKKLLTIFFVLFSLIGEAQTVEIIGCDVALPIIERPRIRRNIDKKTMVAVYPNPASTIINVTLASPSQVRLTNTLGQYIYETRGEKQVQIPVNFPAGVYYVQVIDAEQKIIKKVVVTNR